MILYILILTAATLGFVHTLLGPDHYIPFIAISKAKNWSISKTLWITALCGVGHVLGSIVLGLIGIFTGVALGNLEIFESSRGTIAAYLFIVFGLVYTIYGLRKAYRNKPHQHVHVHTNGTVHTHTHIHQKEHTHVHKENKGKNMSGWALFIIFVFGPCEVLIPLLMYPAAYNNYGLLVATTLVFAVVTVFTMVLLVAVALYGFRFARFKRIGRFSHAFAGILILLCGLAIQFFGL